MPKHLAQADKADVIYIHQLCKSFSITKQKRTQSVQVIRDLSFEVQKGEFITLYGPNGCGKSVLISILNGLLPYDKGHVSLFGSRPGIVNVGCVFQNYRETLFPWRKNIDNISLPLEFRHIPKKERYIRATELKESLGLTINNEAYPYHCSGGEQQRVAIAQALIDNPSVVFMDEPFSALDFETRLSMQGQILDIWNKLKLTIFFVSHDIDEAIYLGQKIVFLSPKPCRVVKILPVSLPYPRDPNLLGSEEFFALRRESLAIFRSSIGQ